MQDSLEKIRALCRDLAVKNGLNDEARDELCGHMEDKLEGYLRGTMKISAEDALVLVRAHFGDAEKVAGQIAGVRKEIFMMGWTWIAAWTALAIVAMILTPQIQDPMAVVLGVLVGISLQKIWSSDSRLGRQVRTVSPWLLGLFAVAFGPGLILPALAKVKQQRAQFAEVLGPVIFGSAAILAGIYLIALSAQRKLARRA